MQHRVLPLHLFRSINMPCRDPLRGQSLQLPGGAQACLFVDVPGALASGAPMEGLSWGHGE